MTSTSEPPPAQARSARSTGRLQLSGDGPAVRFGIYDALGRLIAAFADQADHELTAGVYEVVAQRATRIERRLVRVRGNETRLERFELPVPGAPTVLGTADYDAGAAEAAEAASTAVANAGGARSGLAVVLSSLEQSRSLSRRWAVTLTDLHGREVPWTRKRVVRGCLTFGARAPKGAYVLRTTWRDEADRQAMLEQTVGLVPERQTVVWMPAGAQGVHARFASVHTTPLEQPWDGSDQTALLGEILLGELRTGQPRITPAVFRLASSEGADPMVALYAAHIAMISGEPDTWPVTERLVKSLTQRLPGHPDVLALRLSGALRAEQRPRGTTVSPPMLAASYWQALLPADRSNPATLPAGSLAEEVAGSALAGGPWLQWAARRPAEKPTSRRDRVHLDRLPAIVVPALAGLTVGRILQSSRVTGVLAGNPVVYDVLRRVIRRRAQAPQPRPSRSAAADRVETYVQAVARRREVEDADAARELGAGELGRRLTMPDSLVSTAFNELGY